MGLRLQTDEMTILINEAAGYANTRLLFMYAPPKAAVLVSVVLSLVPVTVGTLLRLLCLVPYSVKLCHNAFSFRRILFFGWLSLDLLLPFRKLPLITLYYALSLIVGGHECLPVRVPLRSSLIRKHSENQSRKSDNSKPPRDFSPRRWFYFDLFFAF